MSFSHRLLAIWGTALIALLKNQIPAILAKNAAKWTKELLDDLQGGGDGKGKFEKYRQREVKDALIAETHSKCAYCETNPLAVTYGDIEHVIPKRADPSLAFDWDNLTLACDVCNTNKSIHEYLIDPYRDNPADEFEFFGPMIMHRPDRDRAELTKNTLELNRIPLLERRRSRLENFTKDIHRILAKTPGPLRDLLLKSAIDHECGVDQEYAACVRAHVANLKANGTLP